MDKKSYAEITKAPRILTPKEVRAETEKVTKRFQTPHRLKSLTAFFERGQKTNITQCICLGLGGFMSVETKPTVLRESIGSFNASLHRLATLDVLLKGLTKEGNAKMPVYLHDTLFTPPERKYLQSSGYILFRDDDDDDSSLATMSTSTFLFVPFLRDGTISLALIDSFPALYVGIGIDRAVEHISTCDAKDLRGGRERSIHPLERFKTVSTETPRLPIFADRNQQGLERWSDARVRWLDPGYYVKKAKAADRMKKEGGGSKAGNQRTPASGAPGKGTEKIIDYWTWEPHKEGC